MLSLPHRWHTGLVLALGAALLTACGSTPESLPSRAGLPTNTPGDAAGIGGSKERVSGAALRGESAAPAIFAQTRAALAAGDWLAAKLALNRVADTLENTGSDQAALSRKITAREKTARENPAWDTAPRTAPLEGSQQRDADSAITALWRDYYAAKVALLSGDIDGHGEILAALKSRALPIELQQALVQHDLEIARLSGDAAAQLQHSLRLLPRGADDPQATATLTAASWTAAQHVNPAAMSALKKQGDQEIRGWLDLAKANTASSPRDAAAALTAWQSQYPRHSASGHASALLDGALRDARSAKIALLLPLSGPLEKAGEALSRGFIAAYYADRNRELSLDVLDSQRYSSVAAGYADARARGADIVVGPLGKREVEALLAEPELPVPLLTLNRPEPDRGGAPASNPGALQLSLAPEDEAEQLAEDAYAGGARRAFLIRPEGSWGDRMEAALAARWRQLGGQMPARAIYTNAGTDSDAIRDALGLGESAARSRTLRALFTEPVETQGRRREDLNVVFLLSKSSEEAQAIKPLVNYHYAGDLPIYALSTADSGIANSSLNRDLGGLRLLTMPWRFDQASLPGIKNSDAMATAPALHALGADAYALARRWWRMQSAAAPSYRGLTAELRPTATGSLERRLSLAEFDRGALRPR